ncbi:hypothetical protein [Methylococcus capsulatus]|uniref:Uncharacterized protein n=1 Tax=Methylococcus capsulatus TaxID=414 RepID=A0AA35V313_METCP|nr:hypothetical protein [Methylococcus capsulatus]CAI8887952.1 conserved protein of unknown function [Methylococcus capsulatus]
MYAVLTYDRIAMAELERLPRDPYEVASGIQHPDAILLRSFDLQGVAIPESVRCGYHPHHIGIANGNGPDMVSGSAALGEANPNVPGSVDKSQGGYAYTLIDLNAEVPPAVPDRTANIRRVPSIHRSSAH